ncbi:hypothetical protein MKX08_009261 [Trichoderma sp. CBMAI-0020]|nr:hypothetical protein MKX08_009261 [Trichoderma sp. CBMAI-0020]
MDPRVKHSLRFTIEPYSERSEGYDLTYAFMQRDLNEMREKLEQVQSELSDLKNIVQPWMIEIAHLLEYPQEMVPIPQNRLGEHK